MGLSSEAPEQPRDFHFLAYQWVSCQLITIHTTTYSSKPQACCVAWAHWRVAYLLGVACVQAHMTNFRAPKSGFFSVRLDQYAIAKFAKSFEMVPKTLAENAGLNAMEIISSLYAEHASGNTKVGLDLEEGRCKDVSTLNIWDLHITKFFALKYAVDVACIVLRVD
ncbi:T-complex protein 1 subunit theta-like [Prunus yedoensis var. nudiflora]|uniref:T-complex protein 1 subunit theta-like n=1 Tax=Prunus yedoensis var. nudiflora TaxID=2094558 RepID=A0A314Y631_PRUYE|nr:T-complex protein 1 subunit theta-like [Prunus yedoensis var. nudiflora]